MTRVTRLSRALVLFATVTAVMTTPTTARSTDECVQRGNDRCGTVVSGSGAITWVYEATSATFYGFHNHGQRSSDKNAYFFVPACSANVPTADDPWGGDEFCGPAGTACPSGVLFWIYTRPIDTPDVVPTRTGDACITPDLAVPVDDLRATVGGDLQRWLASRRFDSPTVFADPAGRALVKLPVIFWTQPVAPTALAITAPFPASVDIEPHLSWSFGEPGTAPDSAGAAYDGIDPRADPGHYPVSHTYRQGGRFPVTVTVTWQATALHVPGVGDFPVAASVTVAGGPRLVDVGDARAVLTDG